MPLEHWMMFGTFAEQDYFVCPSSNSYSGVVINANMAAHRPAGLASFIIGKTDSDGKYIVDPITHAFQHDPKFISNKGGDVKSSIRLLAEAYGPPVVTHIGKSPMLPSHFRDGNLTNEFVSRVLSFQRDHLRAFMAESDAAKYLEEHEIKRPSALIAPYFYLTDTSWDGWLPVNLDCAERAVTMLLHDERLFIEVVVDRGILLDKQARGAILDGYMRFAGKVAGCLLWVDNFDEQNVPTVELQALKSFCEELKGFAPEVISLHGGYFSIMLGGEVGGNSLTGVTHGPEFGEFRSVVPVGGGIPIARYYVPRLHARVRYREAAEILNSAGWLQTFADFRNNVCDCPECISTLDGNPDNFIQFGKGEIKNVRRGTGFVRIEFPLTATKLRCLRHYLHRKHREFEFVRKAVPGRTLEGLKASIADYQHLVGQGGVGHLARWQNALTKKEGI